jgi:hypothetical protein
LCAAGDLIDFFQNPPSKPFVPTASWKRKWLIDKNQDTTLPHRRAEQLWESLFAKGLLPIRFCARKWAVCRELLVEYGIIWITNRE